MGTREAVEKYMELGFKVVFLQPGRKDPDLHWWGPVAKSTAGEIKAAMIEGGLAAGCNIGLYMTSQFNDDPTKCLFALDFDDPELYQEWKQANPELANTPTQKTPGGYHVLFLASEPFNCAKSERMDFIGANWHIAVWPSTHPGGQPYEWLIAPWDAPLVQVRAEHAPPDGPCYGIPKEVWEALDWDQEDYDDRPDEDDHYEGWSHAD